MMEWDSDIVRGEGFFLFLTWADIDGIGMIRLTDAVIGRNSLSCFWCERIYPTPESLINHVKVTHENLDPISYDFK